MGAANPAKTERNNLIYARWLRGALLKELAAEHGLSSTRIGQIASREHRANIKATMEKTMAECKSCGAIIVWLRTKQGHNMPVDYHTFNTGDPGIFDLKRGHISHFATCPNASRHRKSL